MDRQKDLEARPLFDLALNIDPSTSTPDKGVNNGQSPAPLLRVL